MVQRQTHSRDWDRIAMHRLSLRPSVVVHRRHFRRSRGYVLHDPAANQFFRLDPISYYLVALLDGQRTVEEAWDLTMQRYGDQAPTQAEVIALLSQLFHANLVVGQGLTNTDQLFGRMQLRERTARRRRYSSLLFVKIPLFDPGPAIDWLLPILRPLLSRWGLVAWMVLVVMGLSQVMVRWRQLWAETTDILRPSNLLWLVAIFMVVKLIHEFGHGLVCRRFGGQVHEMGVMLLVFSPVPYCDATSSWGFASRLQRALVGMAGIVVELAFASVAAIVWASSSRGVLHELAHNAIFISSVSTLLFNANPLLRFDGYYVLTDLLDIPNLLKNANAQILTMAQRCVFGMSVRPVTHSRSEQCWLLLYGVLAWGYRVTVMFVIIWFVSQAFFGLGAVLAAIALIGWVVKPLLKSVRFLAAAPALAGHRLRATAMTAGLLALLVLGIGVWPAERHAFADAMIEVPEHRQLVTAVDGFVHEVLVEDGQQVEPGQAVINSVNPLLPPLRQRLLAWMAMEQLRADMAVAAGLAAEKEKALAQIVALREQLLEVDQQIEDLTLRSPSAGRIIAPWLSQMTGRFLARGQVIAEVHSRQDLQARAVIGQAHNAPLIKHAGQDVDIELRTAGQLGRVISGKIEHIDEAGTGHLRHRSFGLHGGGQIRTRIDDLSGLETQAKIFEVIIALEPGIKVYPGQRAKVRITVGHAPLAVQWWHRLLQLL